MPDQARRRPSRAPPAAATRRPRPESLTKVTLRLGFGPPGALGPGKVRLLELVGETGSISAAGRTMGMSYRRAWLLVDSLNRCFREPVLRTRLGGRTGGGAELTRFGRELIQRYRSMERKAGRALADHLAALERELANPGKMPSGPPDPALDED
jgi:molybdate transport system regulatory protein